VTALAALAASVRTQGADPPPITLHHDGHLLTIRGPAVPGGAIEINYPEAYCRANSTDTDWVQHTVIPHRQEFLSGNAAGTAIRLRDSLAEGLTVTHTITAGSDEVSFRLDVKHTGPQRSEAHWAQACIRLSAFCGFPPESAANATDYLPQCFLFLDGKLSRMPTRDWAKRARYTPGQVWRSPAAPATDVNPRPLHPAIPDLGLIGAFSADGKTIFATAWEPWQELFQGVIRCLHADFRLGGLEPGASLAVKGKIYLIKGSPDDLLQRYQQDFPEHRRLTPASPAPLRAADAPQGRQ
jgi:hypothetical protein